MNNHEPLSKNNVLSIENIPFENIPFVENIPYVENIGTFQIQSVHVEINGFKEESWIPGFSFGSSTPTTNQVTFPYGDLVQPPDFFLTPSEKKIFQLPQIEQSPVS